MTAMLNPTPRWSHARGNTVVPSHWQATQCQELALSGSGEEEQ
jgi:hypothetical protein